MPSRYRLKLLVEYLEISDALITASSELSFNHAANRVRLNCYLDYACAWSPAADDPKPWVQFDMEQDVTVWGVVVKPRCDHPYTNQRVTLLKVFRSDDEVLWQDASGVISANYSFYHDSTIWLDEATSARYWKIEALAWKVQLSMKADLIGLSKGTCPPPPHHSLL